MKSFLTILALSTGINIVNADSYSYPTNDILNLETPNYSGYFYYPGGADYDFWWTVQNNTSNIIYGSVDAITNNLTASWNNLLLDSKENTLPQRGPYFIRVDPIFAAIPNYWRADVIYKGRRYITSADPTTTYAFQCNIGSFSLSAQIIFAGDDKPIMSILPEDKSSCKPDLLDMGPVGSFNYLHGATYDFYWTVENDAPYEILGSFDTLSLDSSNDEYKHASFNNIQLDNSQITQIGQGPYFRTSTNYWSANLKYNGKRYFAYGQCGIELKDIGQTPIHVFVRGDKNGLTDLLIGKPTNWCDPIPFTYMGPASEV
ncbi:MAG: hypothetical protein K0R94_9 [Burkholderiales bacterium]|jgi:hypothetical protein|nr:hypothetical protein [Burkholderiales bacterium]